MKIILSKEELKSKQQYLYELLIFFLIDYNFVMDQYYIHHKLYLLFG